MAKGGKRTGAGRKPGTKNQETLERERVLAAFRQRTMQAADVLFNAQLTLARGLTHLYKIEKELQIGPKGGKRYVASKPKLVINQWEIEAYLQGLVEEGDADDENDPNATYYFITTKPPDNRAIDSLLDRSLGKTTEKVDLTSGGQPLNFVWEK